MVPHGALFGGAGFDPREAVRAAPAFVVVANERDARRAMDARRTVPGGATVRVAWLGGAPTGWVEPLPRSGDVTSLGKALAALLATPLGPVEERTRIWTWTSTTS